MVLIPANEQCAHESILNASRVLFEVVLGVAKPLRRLTGIRELPIFLTALRTIS